MPITLPIRRRLVLLIVGLLALVLPLFAAPLPVAAAPAGFRLPFAGTYPIGQSKFCMRGTHDKVPEAIDYQLPSGTPVLATEAGTVEFAADGRADGRRNYGGLVRIRHDNGMVSWYGHLKAFNVIVGQRVLRDEQIGVSGGDRHDPMAGFSSGAHLHFEVRDAGGKLVQITDLPGTTSGGAFGCGEAAGSEIPWRASWVRDTIGQSAVRVAPGSIVSYTMTFRNDGSQTWPAGSTRLGTVLARDRDSAFFHQPTWVGSRRAATLTQDTPPGAEATFTVTFQVPSRRGTYREHFFPVIDGQAWTIGDLTRSYFAFEVR